MTAHGVRQVAAIGHLLIVGPNNDVAGFEPGFLRGAAFFHRANQNSFTVFHAEEFSKLAAQALRLYAQYVRISLNLEGIAGDFNVGDFNAGDPGNDDLGMGHTLDLAAIAELHADLHGVAVTADAEAYRAPGRSLAKQPAQLLFALNGGAVKIQNHVMLFQAGFACRSILVHHGNFHTTLLLELEGRHALLGHVLDVHAQVRTAGGRVDIDLRRTFGRRGLLRVRLRRGSRPGRDASRPGQHNAVIYSPNHGNHPSSFRCVILPPYA